MLKIKTNTKNIITIMFNIKIMYIYKTGPGMLIQIEEKLKGTILVVFSHKISSRMLDSKQERKNSTVSNINLCCVSGMEARNEIKNTMCAEQKIIRYIGSSTVEMWKIWG
jgi:hypothetical protein